jgi:hypothetical protein
MQEPTMSSTPDTPAPTSRRDLLVGGAFGAAATAFLAACGGGGDSAPLGQSGIAPSTTLVMPTVPLEEPSDADLADDVTQLRTATSLELLAAQLYAQYAPRIADAEWSGHAARFAADHEAAAEAFAEATPAAQRVTEPNQVVQENTVDPVIATLQNDTAILNFFAGIERTLAATYLTATAAFNVRDGRANFAAHAAAAARRAALMGNGGEGVAPRGPLFPTTDLIAGSAYLSEENAMLAEAEAEGGAEGEDPAAE